MRLSRPLPGLLASMLLLACAEDVPGKAPPADQLHYPMGMVLVPGASPAEDLLLVASSDFDQRFNAGSILALSVNGLFGLAGTSPAYPESFGDLVKSSVKIDPFAGEVLFVPEAPGAGRVYTTSRGKNRVTMVKLAGGQLSCTTGAPAVAPTDCSEAHLLRTYFDDPFALSYTPEAGGLIAVGHQQYVSEVARSPILLFRTALFDQRIATEQAGNTPSEEGVLATVEPLPGVAALSFVGTPRPGRAAPDLLVAHRDPVSGQDIVLSLHDVEANTDPLGLGGALALPIFALTGANQTKALTAAGDRVYLSVRFAQPGSASVFSAAVMVVAVEGKDLRVLSLLEVGEELGKPFLLERPGGGRLLYVPDVRTDSIFILDASSDQLSLAGFIEGRRERTLDGAPLLAHTLDGPSWITFATRDTRTLGFVGNFANSTLAIIDVSDPSPAKHAVVERIGRVLNTDGTPEEAP